MSNRPLPTDLATVKGTEVLGFLGLQPKDRPVESPLAHR
jgi:hypothetical protein